MKVHLSRLRLIHFDIQGAPESILERCSYVRLASDPENAIAMTDAIRSRISDVIYEYGTTKSLRCLALATVDQPKKFADYDLRDPKNYVKYEVLSIVLIQIVNELK